MQNEFNIGDYVYAEDWFYGKIVYLTDKFAEIAYQATNGIKSKTFALEDLKHAEPKKGSLNYGQKEND